MTKKTALWAVLMCGGAVLVILGVLNGGARDMLAKGIKICSECIGLG